MSVSLGGRHSLTTDCQYQIECLLGKGSFAEVYRVRHNDTLYALKKINQFRLRDPRYSQALHREIAIMQKLNHPNIVKLHQVHQTEDNELQLLLEYVAGGSLFDRLKLQGRLPEHSVKKYILDIVSAIKYLHSFERPILHRDIKPENILLTQEDRVKLCDFGSANMIVPDEHRESYVGTQQYMAPQMRECRPHDQALDLWCLGVLIYELLTGRVPGEGGVQFPSHVSRCAEDLVRRLLVRDKARRIKLDEIEQHVWFVGSVGREEGRPVLVGRGKGDAVGFRKYSRASHRSVGSNVECKEKQQQASKRSIYSIDASLVSGVASRQISQLRQKLDLQFQLRLLNRQIQLKSEAVAQSRQLHAHSSQQTQQILQQLKQRIQQLHSTHPVSSNTQTLASLRCLVTSLFSLKTHLINLPAAVQQRALQVPDIQLRPSQLPLSEYIPHLNRLMLEEQLNCLIELKLINLRRTQITHMLDIEQEEEPYLQEESTCNFLVYDKI